MNSKLFIVLSFFLIALAQESLGQVSERLTVGEWTNSISERTPRCRGTIITDRHVLTSAECATVSGNSRLAITHTVQNPIGWGFTESSRSVGRIFIHPNYTGQSSSSNIAVLRVGFSIILSL